MSKEINLNQIQVHDGFWSEMQNLVTDVVIPFQERVLHDEEPGVEKSHAIENFRIAAGLSEGEFYGMVFQDSDVAKWLEGVAYSLMIKPDAELEKRADEIIDIVAAAQQEDGYLNTYFTIKEPEHRWQNLLECHELYCAGHMMEAAVAYYEATGKDKLLCVMERMAEHIIDRFGQGKQFGIPGHQEVEVGLMRLYHATGKESYKQMARIFLERRGTRPYFEEEAKKRDWQHFGTKPEDTKYNQSHAPVYEQDEAVGHSVRAVYMYTAMADLAAEDEDEKLFDACKRLWNNIVQEKMYITGGIGSTVVGESFSVPYELPNDTVYAETCASIGLVFFAKQMLKSEKKGCYGDVMERALYNGIISGMQRDGKRFFYVNPLEVNPGTSGVAPGYEHVLPERPGWYACACCPPNLVRLLTSLGKYAWDQEQNTVYSHLFLGGELSLDAADIHVESAYPWEGKVSYRISAKTKEAFTLAIRLPGYVKPEAASLTVNGEKVSAASVLRDGYLYLTRNWGSDDAVELSFELPVRKVYANPKVREDVGLVSLMRGPVVYCFEGVDNGEDIQGLFLDHNFSVETHTEKQGVLAGMTLLDVSGQRLIYGGGEALYSEEVPSFEPVTLRAIPYFVWGNRGLNQMRVWVHEK
jgi:hypothetical protein